MTEEPSAIIVLSGGIEDAETLTPWTQARVDGALELFGSGDWDLILSCSAYTVHKPPVLDADGFPVLEGQVMADVLRARGVSPDRLLIEGRSLDTIGNAFFSRVTHCEPRGIRRLAVVTSRFHMPRSKALFEWVYGATPSQPYELSFHAVEDVGLAADQVAVRQEREAASLRKVEDLFETVTTLPLIHRWLFNHHHAYAAAETVERARGAVLDSY